MPSPFQPNVESELSSRTTQHDSPSLTESKEPTISDLRSSSAQSVEDEACPPTCCNPHVGDAEPSENESCDEDSDSASQTEHPANEAREPDSSTANVAWPWRDMLEQLCSKLANMASTNWMGIIGIGAATGLAIYYGSRQLSAASWGNALAFWDHCQSLQQANHTLDGSCATALEAGLPAPLTLVLSRRALKETSASLTGHAKIQSTHLTKSKQAEIFDRDLTGTLILLTYQDMLKACVTIVVSIWSIILGLYYLQPWRPAFPPVISYARDVYDLSSSKLASIEGRILELKDCLVEMDDFLVRCREDIDQNMRIVGNAVIQSTSLLCSDGSGPPKEALTFDRGVEETRSLIKTTATQLEDQCCNSDGKPSIPMAFVRYKAMTAKARPHRNADSLRRSDVLRAESRPESEEATEESNKSNVQQNLSDGPGLQSSDSRSRGSESFDKRHELRPYEQLLGAFSNFGEPLDSNVLQQLGHWNTEENTHFNPFSSEPYLENPRHYPWPPPKDVQSKDVQPGEGRDAPIFGSVSHRGVVCFPSLESTSLSMRGMSRKRARCSFWDELPHSPPVNTTESSPASQCNSNGMVPLPYIDERSK